MATSVNNLSLAFPPSNSSTNGTRRKYIFSPINRDEKILFSLVMFLLCCFAIVANATILYYSRRGWRQNRKRRTPFKRSLTYHFVQSLAWTDFLSALTIPPIFIGQIFLEIALREWRCKLLRYLTIFFPTVTLTNLMVIGAERYIAVFYPFFAITKKTAKKLIFTAWIFGGLVTLVPAATYKVVRQDVSSHDGYTLICKYDRRVPLYRMLIISFTVVVYIIPSLILVVTSIRIIRYLSQRKLLGRKKNKTKSWRFKRTSMFLKLIFSYVIPYFLYVTYVIIYLVTGGEIRFEDDFIIRRCSGLLAFSNTLVNPIIFYLNIGGLRKMFRDLTGRFRFFLNGHFRCNVLGPNENTPSSRNINKKLDSRQRPGIVPPKGWKNRKRRNGIRWVGRNVVLPMGSNVVVNYNAEKQLTTLNNSFA